MITLVEIGYKEGFRDAQAEAIKKDIEDLDIRGIKEVKTRYLYSIEGKIEKKALEVICANLLTDRITQYYQSCPYTSLNTRPAKEIKKSLSRQKKEWDIEVWYKKGVTDTVAETTKKAIVDLGIRKKLEIKTGQKYLLKGKISANEVERICNGLLANKVVHDYRVRS